MWFILASVLCCCCCCLYSTGDYGDDHIFSLYFMLPFFFTTLGLFYHNRLVQHPTPTILLQIQINPWPPPPPPPFLPRAGTHPLCSWATPSATLRGWPLRWSASWDTLAKPCCSSSSPRWSTSSTPCRSCSILSRVPDTGFPGTLLASPAHHLLFFLFFLQIITMKSQ